MPPVALATASSTPLPPLASAALGAVPRSVINHAELANSVADIQKLIERSRPANTNQAYRPKQVQFERFCQRKQYYDGTAVTEPKMLLFLAEEVVNRPLQRRSRKLTASLPLSEGRLSWKSVRLYVSAITDLWQQQRALGINSNPSPREEHTRQYIRSLQREETQRDRANYADKGRDTFLDGYSEAEFKRTIGQLWSHTGDPTADATECHLRAAVDLLFGHYLLSRGGDRRNIELSDLFTFEFPGEGATRCMPLIVTMRAGKENQHGRLETAGALRNRDPHICLLSALAYYLLYRWDLCGERFPDFQDRSRWYDIRLIKGISSNPTAPISYNTQHKWAAKAFKYAGVTSAKKTHIGRASGAKMAELKGVSEDQIRRAGRWNADQMTGCYLNTLPREFMRLMAGFPAAPGCFEIPRANISPPETLLSKIWPDLDRWKGRFGPGSDQIADLAAAGTVNLLLYLREVVLQDSVALRDSFPTSPVWNHEVFRHPDFRPFEREIAAVSGQDTQPSQAGLLVAAMPVLAETLQSFAVNANAQFDKLDRKIELLGERSNRSNLDLRQILSNSKFELQLSQGDREALTGKPSQDPAPAPAPVLALDPAAEAGPSLIPPPLPPLLTISSAPDDSTEPPRHHMCRQVHTVEALWREWTEGLAGQPSITWLDNRWGNRWRAGRSSEIQWYSLRLEIVKEIRYQARSRRQSEEEAMATLQLEQRHAGISLDSLCKRLRSARKQRS